MSKRSKKRQPSASLGSLGLLGESLAEAVAARAAAVSGRPRQLGASVGTLRARERVAAAEAPRMQAVLSHPQFQANPIAAIASHLSATLPPPPPPPAVCSKAEQQARRREKKRRQRQRASAARAADRCEMVSAD